MKKILILTVAIVLVAAGSSFAVVSGSKHDLSGWAGSSLSACQYCHTPHLGTNAAVNGAPLWNRSLAANGSWTLYNSGGTTLGGTQINNPGPNSRTCLSCHDGTVAVGTVLVGVNNTVTKAGVTDASGKLNDTTYSDLTTDLSNEHPIGFVFVAGRGGVPSIPSPYKLYTGNTFECASCHDPHDTNASNSVQFIRGSMSTICTDCHSQK